MKTYLGIWPPYHEIAMKIQGRRIVRVLVLVLVDLPPCSRLSTFESLRRGRLLVGPETVHHNAARTFG